MDQGKIMEDSRRTKDAEDAEKIEIGANVFVCPMAVTLVGTTVSGRPNFMAAGWITRANASPPMLAIGINKNHYTAEGIMENKAFSVNFPSADMVEKVDYCGLVSGRKEDKSGLFDIFYGRIRSAPMIAGCPLCLECNLKDTIELPTNDLFIGEIAGAYTEGRYLTDGKLDARKINPIMLTMPDNSYWSLGEKIGMAWSDGRRLIGKSRN